VQGHGFQCSLKTFVQPRAGVASRLTLIASGQKPRSYGQTGGREGGSVGQVTASRFVVQLHDATTLHFDLRVQAGAVLRSWAVPKGPSLDPAVRRLAVPVEDHALEAGEFEGVYPDARRGSGAVIIWDEGPAEITRDEPGHLSFVAQGSKLAGGFALTRTGQRRWILVKVRDEHARAGSDIAAERPASVRTGRTWQDLARERAGPG
jgi:DNA ligase D-like protein (predicted 3'-phosphoesterase)